MNKSNYNKLYYQTHRNKMLESITANHKYKYDHDFEYNIYKQVMARIIQTFPNSTYSFEDLLRCSLPFYCDSIKFCLDGNPLNDIDHILPINNSTNTDDISQIQQKFKWLNTFTISASLNRSLKDQSKDITNHNIKVKEYLSHIRIPSDLINSH